MEIISSQICKNKLIWNSILGMFVFLLFKPVVAQNNFPVSWKKAKKVAERQCGFNFSGESETGIHLDSLKGQWEISKSKSHPSNTFETDSNGHRINCAKTNGCTVIEIKTILIDANSGKVKGREEKKLVYPNYE